MAEAWKTYPRNPNYEASTLGRVRSKDKIVTTSHGRSWLQKGRVLSPAVNKIGRVSVVLYWGGKSTRKSVQVSHIVAETFLRPRREGEVIRHLNDDSLDNRVENLAIGSWSENARDAVRNGRNRNAAKTECVNGHPFNAANTRITDGHRRCIACSRARARIHDNPALLNDFQAIADDYFSRLMSGKGRINGRNAA